MNTNEINKQQDNKNRYKESKYLSESIIPNKITSPNYKALNMTKSSERKHEMTKNVQFGNPTTMEQKTSKRDATKIIFPKKQSTGATISSSEESRKPLDTIKRSTTQTPKDSTATTSNETHPTPLRNRFDHPLTQRELHQLKLSQLKGANEKIIQQLLSQLLQQSKNISSQLVEKKREEPKVAAIKQEEKKIPSRKDIIQDDIQDAQQDLQFLQDEYPKRSQQEQQDALKSFRAKYNAGPKSNPIHIQKSIRDKIQELNDELQAI